MRSTPFGWIRSSSLVLVPGLLIIAGGCSQAVVENTCSAGETSCADGCVDLTQDAMDCGSCGNACAGNAFCADSSCRCQPGMSACGGDCVELATNANNCGSCGTPCAAGQVCAAGKCSAQCPKGESICGGGCFNLSQNRSHCGSCGTACASNEVCQSGHCTASCAVGLAVCSGSCANLQTDKLNCGSCGHACAAGQVCEAGRCHASCSAGATICGTACVDTATDSANCGICGHACAAGQACRGSTCQGAGVGPTGGSVDLLHFGLSGDTRPPACEDSAHYPHSVIESIADQFKQKNVQFALDLGDHMFVCNGDLAEARLQMGYYMAAVARYPGTFFMTQGNHECQHPPCYLGSTNANYVAFNEASSTVFCGQSSCIPAVKPYYTFDVNTSLGLARFVIIADSSWDSAQQSWLETTLAEADTKARYTLVARHHPEGDTSIATNPDIMSIVRAHKFSLFLAGHTHTYKHGTSDGGRDLVLGIGGAPLISTGTFNGFAMVDQQANGNLKVSVYDLANPATPVDSWSAGPNR